MRKYAAIEKGSADSAPPADPGQHAMSQKLLPICERNMRSRLGFFGARLWLYRYLSPITGARPITPLP